MIVYKATCRRGENTVSWNKGIPGPTTLTYSRNTLTVPDPVFKTYQYGLCVFNSYEQCQGFIFDNYRGENIKDAVVIYECLVIGNSRITNLPIRVVSIDLRDLHNQLMQRFKTYQPYSLLAWPEDTVMVDGLIPLRKLPLHV
ncbi:MAG: hypothetical protein NTZ48_05665 [Candidatus Omnitrophica bacterium]|nr:hypothetical protein [Candidatus Omnitrophota bacterium]